MLFDYVEQPTNKKKLSIPDNATLSQLYSNVHHNDIIPVWLIDPDIEHGPWIAGGAALKWYLGCPVGQSDIDVFCKTQEQSNLLMDHLSELSSCTIESETENAITFQFVPESGIMWKIQIIIRNFFERAEDVIDAFDITVCKIVTDGNSILLGKNTAADVRKKVLKFTGIPKKSDVKRLVKYWTYGYRPDQDTLKFITDNIDPTMLRLNQEDYNDV